MTRKSTYDKRYSQNWQTTCRRARRLTYNRCSLFPILRAAEVHHLYYFDWLGAIAGREKPLWNVFPVSGFAHRLLHSPLLWRKKKNTHNYQVFWVIWLVRVWCWTWVLLAKFSTANRNRN